MWRSKKAQYRRRVVGLSEFPLAAFECVDFGVNFDRRRRKESLESAFSYAVQTAVNGGSELLIFVPRAAHRHDSRSSPGKDCFDCPAILNSKI
jgi:hypothetical protein